jgi:methionyl-tRNA formyltransferase
MKICLIGRTAILAAIGKEGLSRGHEIAAIVTAKESPETVEDQFVIESFSQLHGIALFKTPNFDDVVDQLHGLGIDIGLSINYVSILNDSHIKLFRLGILNAHGGDLPRYRGNACQAWAILNGESSISLCIHRMVGELVDSGDIINRESISISDKTYIGDVYEWMASRIPEMIVNSAEILELNPHFVLQAQSSQPEDSLRTFPRRPEDSHICWRDSRIHILRLVRASSRPFSGAYSTLNGKRITIWRAEEVEHSPFNSVPGQVVCLNSHSFDVSVEKGSSAIRVTDARMENGNDWRHEIRSTRARLI